MMGWENIDNIIFNAKKMKTALRLEPCLNMRGYGYKI